MPLPSRFEFLLDSHAPPVLTLVVIKAIRRSRSRSGTGSGLAPLGATGPRPRECARAQHATRDFERALPGQPVQRSTALPRESAPKLALTVPMRWVQIRLKPWWRQKSGKGKYERNSSARRRHSMVSPLVSSRHLMTIERASCLTPRLFAARECWGAARGRRPLSIPEARKPSVSIMPGSSEFTRILRGPAPCPTSLAAMRKRPNLSFPS